MEEEQQEEEKERKKKKRKTEGRVDRLLKENRKGERENQAFGEGPKGRGKLRTT